RGRTRSMPLPQTPSQLRPARRDEGAERLYPRSRARSGFGLGDTLGWGASARTPRSSSRADAPLVVAAWNPEVVACPPRQEASDAHLRSERAEAFRRSDPREARRVPPESRRARLLQQPANGHGRLARGVRW